MEEIRDFIYLDLEKVSSLFSQLSGGIVQTVEASSTTSANSKNLRNYDFKIFKHEAGGTGTSSQRLKETRVSHHEIYNDLEQKLFQNGYALTIGEDVTKEEILDGSAAQKFENTLCIKVSGNIVIEDYQRITRIAENYETVTRFINESILASLKESPELKDIFDRISKLEDEVKRMKNGPKKTLQKQELENQQQQIEEILLDKLVGKVDEWIIEGFRTWVDVFLKDILNLRVYPFNNFPKFQVMSNLKRESFLEENTEVVHYLFGSKPTLKFTMLGVVTSVLREEEEPFNPMEEFYSDNLDEEGNEQQAFANGFRSVFRGFDGLEAMIRTCRYPRIMVQPVAVYRSIKAKK